MSTFSFILHLLFILLPQYLSQLLFYPPPPSPPEYAAPPRPRQAQERIKQRCPRPLTNPLTPWILSTDHHTSRDAYAVVSVADYNESLPSPQLRRFVDIAIADADVDGDLQHLPIWCHLCWFILISLFQTLFLYMLPYHTPWSPGQTVPPDEDLEEEPPPFFYFYYSSEAWRLPPLNFTPQLLSYRSICWYSLQCTRTRR